MDTLDIYVTSVIDNIKLCCLHKDVIRLFDSSYVPNYGCILYKLYLLRDW